MQPVTHGRILIRMDTSDHSTLRDIRRGEAGRRWTSVVTSAGVGIVLVALATRLGTAAAVVTTLFVVVATAAAVRTAVTQDDRWQRAFDALRNDGAGHGQHDSPIDVESANAGSSHRHRGR